MSLDLQDFVLARFGRCEIEIGVNRQLGVVTMRLVPRVR